MSRGPSRHLQRRLFLKHDQKGSSQCWTSETTTKQRTWPHRTWRPKAASSLRVLASFFSPQPTLPESEDNGCSMQPESPSLLCGSAAPEFRSAKSIALSAACIFAASWSTRKDFRILRVELPACRSSLARG